MLVRALCQELQHELRRLRLSGTRLSAVQSLSQFSLDFVIKIKTNK
jgi:hypothetical protein